MSPSILQVTLIGAGAPLVVFAGGWIVRWILRPYSEQLESRRGLPDGGRIIGYSERLLIYVFVLVQAPTAIGFLIAAKSIYSFGESSEVDPQTHSQYVIIGTLVSFAYAVTLSYIIRWALRLL